MKEIKTMNNILSHLISHIIVDNEPIDERDYEQAKELIDEIKRKKNSQGMTGSGLFDTLDIKDLEKLDKLIDEFKIIKKRKMKNLFDIQSGTKKRVDTELKDYYKSKPDRRFTKKRK